VRTGTFAWEQAKSPEDSPRTVGALLEGHVKADEDLRSRESEYRAAAQAAEDGDDPGGLAAALHRLGLQLEVTGAFDAAEAALARAVEVSATDRALIGERARAANDMAVVLARLGRHMEAGAKLETAAGLASDANLPEVFQAAMRNKGMLAWIAGEKARCLELWDECFRAARAVDDPAGNAKTLNNIAVLSLLDDESGEASQLFNRAVLLAQRAGDLRTLAFAYNNLGLILSGHTRGDHFKAIPFVEMALELLAGPVDIVARLYVLNNNIHVYENAHVEAAREFRARFDETLKAFTSSYPRRGADAERVPYALYTPEAELEPPARDDWQIAAAPVLLRTLSRCSAGL
jgi:tetratricopeptide (TPR) repeat protein